MSPYAGRLCLSFEGTMQQTYKSDLVDVDKYSRCTAPDGRLCLALDGSKADAAMLAFLSSMHAEIRKPLSHASTQLAGDSAAQSTCAADMAFSLLTFALRLY